MSSSEELSPEEKLLKVIQKGKKAAEPESEPEAVPKVADVVAAPVAEPEPAPELTIEILPEDDEPAMPVAAASEEPVEAKQPLKLEPDPPQKDAAPAKEAKPLAVKPPADKPADKPKAKPKPKPKAATPKPAPAKAARSAEPAAAPVTTIDGDGAADDYNTTSPSALAGLSNNLKLDGIGTGIERAFSLKTINMGLGLVIVALIAFAGFTFYDVIQNPRQLPKPAEVTPLELAAIDLASGPTLEDAVSVAKAKNLFGLDEPVVVGVEPQPAADWQAYVRKHIKVMLTVVEPDESAKSMAMLKDSKTGLTHYVKQGASFDLDQSAQPPLPSPVAKLVGRSSVTFEVDGEEMQL